MTDIVTLARGGDDSPSGQFHVAPVGGEEGCFWKACLEFDKAKIGSGRGIMGTDVGAVIEPASRAQGG